jgi:hypothetical protein
VALLAIWGGGDRRLAVDFLRQSADNKLKLAAAAEHTVPDVPSALARSYTAFRFRTSKVILEAQAQAIQLMADALPRSLTSNHPVRLLKGYLLLRAGAHRLQITDVT